MDLGTWSDLCEKERLSKNFYNMIGACEDNSDISYTGEQIKEAVQKYQSIDCNDWNKDELIENFWREYINGITFFSISDKVYYHLRLGKNGAYVVRDIVKSPKRR